MFFKNLLNYFLGVITSIFFFSAAIAADAEIEELRKIIDDQKAALAKQAHVIDDLSDRLDKVEAQSSEAAETAEAAIEAVEDGGGAGGGDGWWTKTSIGGYGELHLEANSTTNQVDAHRYVLFIGHEFNDYLNFNSEFELEHAIAGEGKNGEIELEQMYLQHNWETWGIPNTSAKYGIFLIPVGIINETHEPPTFYGVERNEVEKELGANTWWESGVSVDTVFPEKSVTLTVAAHSGLSTTNGDIRAGRQKSSEQDASAPAYTGRIKWTGIPGLEIAAWGNYHTNIESDSSSSQATPAVSATLIGAHMAYARSEGPGLRILAGQWELDCAPASGTTPKNSCYYNGYSEQWGAYIEPSYKWQLGGQMDSAVGIFARVGARDDQSGKSTSGGNKINQYDVGINYWLAPNAVLKIDYEVQTAYDEGSAESRGFNFGMGYQF